MDDSTGDGAGGMRTMTAAISEVPFLDLTRGLRHIWHELENVHVENWMTSPLAGPAHRPRFEADFARLAGVPHAVGCGSGGDALALALLVGGVGPGTEVLTAANASFTTVDAILRTGAAPMFCDVDERGLLLDPMLAEKSLTPRTRAMVPVHLYGNPAPMPALRDVADRYGLWLVEDCCQAHGASIGGRSVGAWGDGACFSFHPTRNLAAMGNAGAVATIHRAVAERLRRHRGDRPDRRLAAAQVNPNMDDLQAAVLNVRLNGLAAGNERRRQLLANYRDALAGVVRMVEPPDGGETAAHLAVILVDDRVRFQRRLAERGVETMVHYATTAAEHPAVRERTLPRSFPVATAAARRVLSLPCYPELTDEEQRHVVAAVRDAAA